MTTAKTTKKTESFDMSSMFDINTMQEGYEKTADALRDLADFQKEAFEAVVSSAQVYAKGVEAAASEQTTFVKEAYDDGAEAVKAATSAGSVQEALEIQSDFARTTFERNMSFASKLADHWSSVAQEASEPITKGYGAFVEKIQAYRP